MSQLYWSTTPLSIILILLNIVFQNMYQDNDLNEDSDENDNKPKRSIEIGIDLDDKNQMTMFIIGIFLVLFVPIVNILIALIISFSTIKKYLKTKDK